MPPIVLQVHQCHLGLLISCAVLESGVGRPDDLGRDWRDRRFTVRDRAAVTAPAVDDGVRHGLRPALGAGAGAAVVAGASCCFL